MEELVIAVMKNEQMWGQDLTKIPGFLAATIENLQKIRSFGTLAAYNDCLQRRSGHDTDPSKG